MGPTSSLFEWHADLVADQFEVLYEGAVIFDSGEVAGPGSDTVNVPAGRSSMVTVRVSGPFGTGWQYTVNCP